MWIGLDIPPGVKRHGTIYQSRGRWADSQLIRFFQGTIRPFGGWKRVISVPNGPIRGLITHRTKTVSRQAVLGTPTKLYRWNEDTLLDITPAGYQAGFLDAFYGTGYGYGPYGIGPYGVSANMGETPATVWVFDTWGDNVVGTTTHELKIYEYKNDDQPAVLVPNAPGASALFVTLQRNLVAVGLDSDQRAIAWSDFENNTIWTPDVNNAAGDWRFQTDGVLVNGRNTLHTNLIWSTTDVFRMDFIGGTLIFKFDYVGRAGLIAPNAQIQGDRAHYWWGPDNFYAFDGARVYALPCEIRDYVFEDVNLQQKVKIHAGRVAAFNEILWFYPSADSTEPNRCIAYNENEQTWYIVDGSGIMARGAWVDAGAFPRPLAGGADALFEHESGWDAAGEPIVEKRFVRSGPIELGDGESILEMRELISDEETSPGLRAIFVQKFGPTDNNVTYRGPYEVRPPITPIRVTARQIELHLEALADEDFRFGRHRLEAVPGGKR